ncbi:hypothetical protein YC2023_076623 [Brassica napus]
MLAKQASSGNHCASKIENYDAIDASVVGMFGDPKETREGIKEVHFFPFNPVNVYLSHTLMKMKTSIGAANELLRK